MPDPAPKVPPPTPNPPAAGTLATQPEPPASSSPGEMVTVACKLPSGVHLRLDHMQDGKFIATAQRVTLNGANSSRVIGGYGMTEVPKAFWDEWLKQNADFQPLQAKPPLIFAQAKPQMAEGQAKEQAAATSGLERLDPGRPGAKLEPVAGAPSSTVPTA